MHCIDFVPTHWRHSLSVSIWLMVLLLPMSTVPSRSFAAPTAWYKQFEPQLAARVERNEAIEVLVLLDDTDEQVAEQQENQGRSRLFEASGDAYRQRIDKRTGRMKALKAAVSSEIADADLQVLTDYPVLPMVHMRISSARALEKLARNRKVLSIDENRPRQKFLAQSLPLIERTNAQIANYTGKDATVAVLDTGVNYKHAVFGSCSAPGDACKVVYAEDLAIADGALDDDGHGTNVAAIVLGVAPDAKIAALDVFRTDGYAYDSDLIKAINWCVTNKATYNIVAMNMSLGSGRYYAPVAPNDTWGTAIQRAVDVGIAVVAASGNNGYTNSISLPAAYANVISVGAVYDSNMGGVRWSNCSDSSTFADKVTCFSNSASFLTVLAPGAIITAADIAVGGLPRQLRTWLAQSQSCGALIQATM